MNISATGNAIGALALAATLAYIIGDTLHDQEVETFVNVGARFTHDDGVRVCEALNEARQIHDLPALCCETFKLQERNDD